MKHAEIWDDSALIQSWDEALEEYNRYHSIHAKGEKVEDVIKDAEGPQEEQLEDGEVQSNGAPEHGVKTILEVDALTNHFESHEADVPITTATEDPSGWLQPDPSATLDVTEQHPNVQAGVDMPSLATLPENLLVPGQDEVLKNLLMSWYYAGYYTGLYEGQQRPTQAQVFQSEHPQPGGKEG